jgi:hypothetical protein
MHRLPFNLSVQLAGGCQRLLWWASVLAASSAKGPASLSRLLGLDRLQQHTHSVTHMLFEWIAWGCLQQIAKSTIHRPLCFRACASVCAFVRFLSPSFVSQLSFSHSHWNTTTDGLIQQSYSYSPVGILPLMSDSTLRNLQDHQVGGRNCDQSCHEKCIHFEVYMYTHCCIPSITMIT